MKIIQYLLIFYAFFIIFIGPALKIVGDYYHYELISNKEYFLTVAFFLGAVFLFTKKKNQEA